MKRRCKGTSIRLFMQKIIVKNSKTTNCQGWNFRYNYHYQLDRTNKKFICSQYDKILFATLPSRQTAIWQFIDADAHCFIVRFRQFGLSDGFDFCSVQRNLSVKWYNWNTFHCTYREIVLSHHYLLQECNQKRTLQFDSYLLLNLATPCRTSQPLHSH